MCSKLFKMKKVGIIITFSFLLLALNGLSQIDRINDSKYLSDRKMDDDSYKQISDSAIISIFRTISPQIFNAPELPRFTFIGKDNKFYCGIGGFIKGTVSYDFSNPIDNPMYFITNDIPVDCPHANKGFYQMSAGSSNIFLNFVAMPTSRYQVGGYINFNFENENYGLSLQYAYLIFGGFMFGYNYSTFCNEEAVPPTIDLEGPPTLPLILNTILNYKFNLKNWQFCLGIETPLTSATLTENTRLSHSTYPTVPAYIQYGWNNSSSMVRLSGVFRTMQYENTSNGDTKYESGVGVQISGKIDVDGKFITYFQGLAGNGISSFTQDMCDSNYDLVPDGDNENRLKKVKLWGGMIGLQYNISERLMMSASYGYEHFYAKKYSTGVIPWNEQTRYLNYATANIFCNLTDNITLGFEYINGIKNTMGGLTKNNNRIQAMMQFNF